MIFLSGYRECYRNEQDDSTHQRFIAKINSNLEKQVGLPFHQTKLSEFTPFDIADQETFILQVV